MAQASRSADRLSALIQYIYGRNPFYTRKLDAAGIHPPSLKFPDDLSKLPLTTKHELIADQQASPPWGTNLTEPLDRYTRYNQTSSTTGSPLRWLDTNEAGSGCSSAGRLCMRARRSTRATASSFRFRSGRFSDSGRRSRPAARLARTAFPPAACRARRACR